MAEAEHVTETENKAEAERTGRLGGRGRMIAVGAVVALAVIAFFVWRSSGQQSTDDAQIDGHITQVSSRVGGTVVKLNFQDNQSVKADDVLVELDPRDYQVAVDRAKAELADAEANAAAAKSGIPITEVSTSTGTRSATGGLEEAQAGVGMADSQIESARAQLVAAQARQRDREATATKAARDVERLKGLVAKEEIPQQQFDAAVAASESARAAADAAHSEAAAAETAIAVAEHRARQSRGTAAQAQAAVQATRSAPQQIQVTRARAAMADARVQQSQAALEQAELNLRRTHIKAPSSGVVSRKNVEVGQVVQPGQPLLALVSQDDLWVTANFKETQLKNMRAGQRAKVSVDALGRDFDGHVDSIAPATGAKFSLLPPENATGNYVKVVQRVPVKIVIDPGQDPEHRLRPGMSVAPSVSTSK
ncbi:MAG TPA: HlyD family secretion protein [Vicinamibacterales bacterium]|nr:HlyD family secretion protein [Vicinamibacterales bacterium]